ncbi:MAG: hypothetical protein NVSMB21_13410 [Vulcanimicrobiaceae bacterium]
MKRRRLFIALGAVVAAIVLGFGWTATHRSAAASPRGGIAARPNVPLATAHRGDFIERVEAQGRIGPPAGSSAKLAFAQAGILATVLVRVGETVRAGAIVAELDRASLAAAVSQAAADAAAANAGFANGAVAASNATSATAKLAAARTRLATLERGGLSAQSSQISARAVARQAALKVESDRATLARDEALLAGGVLARKDVDAARAALAADLADLRASGAKVAAAGSDLSASLAQARADVAAAENDVQAARSQGGVLGGQAASARARLEAARIAYANGVLVAPADGVVLAVAKRPGESVDPTQPVVEIGPALGRGVTLSVPADVARRIVVGDLVTLRLSQTRERVARGRVTAVVPATDPTTQLATVTVGGAPADVVAGDAVSATIVVGRRAGIIVPSTAIVQDPQSGKTVVFVRDEHPKDGESGFSLRDVRVRASDSETAVLDGGVRAGERVAARGGYALLAPGGA